MPAYSHTVGTTTYRFADLKALLAKVTPHRSGDVLAGIAAHSAEERVAAPIAHLTVGDLRNWLLGYEVQANALTAIAPGLTPEVVAAVSKIMRIQDMVLVASKARVVTRFRNTLGLPGRLARLSD